MITHILSILIIAFMLPNTSWAQTTIHLKGDISKPTVLESANLYIVTGKVHVRPGVELIVGRNTTILLRNGIFSNEATGLREKSTLIFEGGSSLKASRFAIKAGNESFEPAEVADNGGVLFLGTSTIAQKNGETVMFRTRASRYQANQIQFAYLGKPDSVNNDRELSGDQYDAVSILGMGRHEWFIRNLITTRSGRKGIDIRNSILDLTRLAVTGSGDACVSLFDTRLNILNSLQVEATGQPSPGSLLFDFGALELIDKGPSRLRIAPGGTIRLRGYVNRYISLLSQDLPAWTRDLYEFDGVSSRGQTYIFSTAISSN